MLRRCLIAPLAALVLTAIPGNADVKWANTDVVLKLDSSQESGVATFAFVNEGDSAVTITKVSAGCGCTVPKLEKQEFAPGESGSFTAKFSIGERRGFFRIPIHVDFADGDSAQLNLAAQIRELVEYSPVNLVWGTGEERKPKDIELHWKASDPVEVTQVRSINPAFKVTLVPEHGSNGAIVRVTPTGDKLVGTTVVIVQTAQGPERRLRAYTVVGRAL